MCDALRDYLHYHTPNEQGVTKYEHLEQVEKQTGRSPLELESITEPPEPFLYIWHWFFELHGARQAGGFGPNPISYSEIKAWCEAMNIFITPWEIAVIKAMDREYMQSTSENRKKDKRQAKGKGS